jgi:plastocyanin domain-containing protein
MKRMLIVFLIVLISSLAAADEKFVEKKYVATIDSDGVQRVSIVGGSYFFDPNVIIVKVNVPVELSVKKESGITPHTIALSAPEAGINFKEDLSTTPKIIRFTPTQTGSYPFECTQRFLFFKSHKDRGMHGILEVVQ